MSFLLSLLNWTVVCLSWQIHAETSYGIHDWNQARLDVYVTNMREVSFHFLTVTIFIPDFHVDLEILPVILIIHFPFSLCEWVKWKNVIDHSLRLPWKQRLTFSLFSFPARCVLHAFVPFYYVENTESSMKVKIYSIKFTSFLTVWLIVTRNC